MTQVFGISGTPPGSRSATPEEEGRMRDAAHPANSPLSRVRERDLLARTEAGERAATEELVTAFMPAIDGVASLYGSLRSLERRELQQEGVVGLLRASQRYDRGYET